jgi:putative ABC transport system substrate-binding protein
MRRGWVIDCYVSQFSTEAQSGTRAKAWSRAASYVNRIFKGAAPSELPVEQVDRFQFIINLKTANAIGFDPTSLLSRADEVIQ